MAGRKLIVLGVVAFCATAILAGRSLSRPANSETKSPPEKERRWPSGELFDQVVRQWHKEANERRLQQIKEALAVTDQQWQVIEPKLKKVEVLLQQAQLAVGISGLRPAGGQITFSPPPRLSETRETRRTRSGMRTRASRGAGGGGFGVGYTFPWKGEDRPPTEGEKTCEELHGLLANNRGSQQQIREKMQTLRKARAQAKKELVRAQNELRELLNLRQQAHLLLAGYID